MKLALVKYQRVVRLALLESDGLYCVPVEMTAIPPDVVRVLQEGDIQSQLRQARNTGRLERVPEQAVTFLPPVPSPAKIVCVGLNYRDHAAESSFTPPRHPVFFARFASGLVGHREALIRPACSVQFDFEGELVAVIGKKVRNATVAEALDAVVGYSIFNDATIRDYQLERGPQWTLGKNFDGTAGFGPAIVTVDELPKGAAGLALTTRLNGAVMQSASTAELIFSVPELIAAATEAFVLEPGDLLVTGTPSGVGFARKPPVFMKAGDIVEISLEGVGLLKNHIVDATDTRAS
jgi:acylpyruvate hydrolase